MPPKGWRSGRDETTTIAIRVPNWFLDCIDTYLDAMCDDNPLSRFSRSDATRDLVFRGLEAVNPGSVNKAWEASRRKQTRERPEKPAASKPSVQPSSTTKRHRVEDEEKQQVIEFCQQYPYSEMSLSEKARELFTREIYKAQNKEGQLVPINKGVLDRWLKRAAEEAER